jgi:hypothetical protein
MVQRCGQIAAKSVRTDFQHRGNIAQDQPSLESIKDAQVGTHAVTQSYATCRYFEKFINFIELNDFPSFPIPAEISRVFNSHWEPNKCRGSIQRRDAGLLRTFQASAGSLLLGNDDDEEAEWPSSDDVVHVPPQRDPLTSLWEELVREADQKRPRPTWRKRSASASSSSLSALAATSAGPENVSQLRQAIAMWENKLMRFAEKFSDNPQLLSHNPTWIRLMQVRDSLQQLLAKHHQLDMLDQTRM